MIHRGRSCAMLFSGLLILTASPALGLEQWDWLGLSDWGMRFVAIAPGDSQTIIAGGTHLSTTTDGAGTWTTRTDINEVWCTAFGSNKNVAFAGTWGWGVYRSTDGCITWNQTNAGLANGGIKGICVDPTSDFVVYACAEDGLHKSTDGGNNWSMVKPGVNASAVAVSGLNPQKVYLVTWGFGVWKSEDGGGSWTEIGAGVLPASGTWFDIGLDSADDQIVYVVVQGGGAWVSFDAGANWTYTTPGFEGMGIGPDPDRPGFVYGLGGWSTPKRSGCYGGASGWKDMSAGWNPSWFARSIRVDPNDSSRVYACAEHAGVVRWIADAASPKPPGTLAATPSGNAVALSWQPSITPDCVGYWVYKRVGSAPYPLTPVFVVSGGQTSTYSDTNVVAGQTYHYRVAAIDTAQNRSALSNEAGAQVAASYELDVTYITRQPHDCHFYWVDYPDSLPILRAGTENDKRWPAYGETVTFEAHFINKGTATTPAVHYQWKVNGQVVGSGTAASVAPGQEGTATVDWQWNIDGLDTDHTDQTVTFELDDNNQITETFEQNNALTDYLEGVGLYIYVDQPIYDAFNGQINLAGTRGFEDWIQAQFKAMNTNFARSTYPLAPQGCRERVRIDKIVVGPQPDPDGIPDGRWDFTGDPGYAAAMALNVDGGLIHELMHQLGIIDLYVMPILAAHNAVITPDGLPCGMGFAFGRPGIMAGGDIAPHTSGSSQTMPEYCTSHDVLGLNRNCGYRRGHYGEYMFDIPANNYLLVKDAAGQPAAGVTVNVYQGNGGFVDGTPVSSATTDAQGRCLLPNRPPVRTLTTATGHTLQANPFGTVKVVGQNATLLLEVSRPGGDFDYHFLNLTDVNLAFWGGNTDTWTYTLNSRLAANSLPRITDLNAGIAPNSVALVWSAVPGAAAYRIYRAGYFLNRPEDPQHLFENWVFQPIGTTNLTHYTDTTRFETCRYAVAPMAADGTEGRLSNRTFAPNLLNPWGVGILPDDQRVILDPQNGWAYLRQTADGVYIANTGSEHDHVEFSHFLAIDTKLNRMLTSHPSDYYGGPHSIRITDFEGNLTGLWDLGTQGSGPGQFNTPGGVAVDESSRIYAVDVGNNRIEIFNPDGSFVTAFGFAGGGNGQFNYPQGIALTSDHRLYVCDQGNHRVQVLRFLPADGAVEYLGLLTGKALNQPTGVAVAANGGIFVTDSEANSVEQYSAVGAWVKSYATALPPYSGSLSYPTGIAIDGRGQVIICDTANRRVVTVATGQGPLSADFNHDGIVNSDDLQVFTDCITGPTVAYDPAHLPAGCVVAFTGQFIPPDFDRDGDVDESDFGVFQRCFSGDVGLPDPNCTQ